jgi:prepilin-type N-terminal cleavage/methylation domain-containing protein
MGVQGLDKKRESGFTLMEMMAVVGIIGILVAVAIPSFSVWLPNYKLKGAIQDLYSNMQNAKMEAIKANGQYTITFDEGADNYTMTPPTGTAKTVTLADYGYGVRFGDPGGGEAVTYTGDSVTFTSRGMVTENDEKWVKLTNDKGRFYQVGTRGTGVIRLQKWNGSSWE